MSRFLQILALLVFFNLVTFVSPNFPHPLNVNAAPLTPLFPISQLGNCSNVGECAIFCDNPVNDGVCTLVGRYLGLLPGFVAGEQRDLETEAAKYGITFPIAELGNCANFAACMNYCEIGENFDKCIAFAKKKGFHQEGPAGGVTFPIVELGNCANFDECRTFCENPANFDTCRQFAEKRGMAHTKAEYHTQTGAKVGITFPIAELGNCGSSNECLAYCENPANLPNCQNFSYKKGFSVSPPTDYPPSTSFPSGDSPGPLATFTPTTGFPCQTEEECRKYCDANPAACGGYTGSGTNTSPYPTYSPLPTTFEPTHTSSPTP